MTDFNIESMVSNWKYFQRVAERNPSATARNSVDILEDAILIYHAARSPPPEELELLKFGFNKGYVVRILTDKYGRIHQIPESLLVQLYMRDLQDGMDRCRP
jgi:hypothetical protein